MHTRIDNVTQTFHIHEIFIDSDVKINFIFIETLFLLTSKEIKRTLVKNWKYLLSLKNMSQTVKICYIMSLISQPTDQAS